MLVGSSESRIDCANLVKQIYGEVYDQKLAGTVINRYPQYTPLESKDMASEGDLVFFKINKSVPSHEGGVFTTWNIFSYHSWRWCDD
jgi:cell wall-associated NlpC family hydrolase